MLLQLRAAGSHFRRPDRRADLVHLRSRRQSRHRLLHQRQRDARATATTGRRSARSPSRPSAATCSPRAAITRSAKADEHLRRGAPMPQAQVVTQLEPFPLNSAGSNGISRRRAAASR
ncbi:hypothetical protein AB5I41_24535 [Sphingomonas sp. MMS24-JH45]